MTCGRIDSITGSYAAVAKYTPGGSRIAELTYNSGNSPDIHLDVVGICADGDPVVAGMEQNNSGDRNRFVQKLNSSFLPAWSSSVPFQSVTWEEASITDDAGNIYITGFSQLSPGGNNSIVTLKYNTTGTLLWSQVFQAPAASIDLRGLEIALDGAGNIYICGTIIPSGVPWSFLTLKYNSNGVLQWNQTYNSTGYYSEFALGIVVDAGGNCYVGGTSSNGSNQNLQIVKYNSSGQQQWDTIFDDPDHLNDHFLSMTLDPSGNLYIAGYAIDNVPNGFHFYLKLTSSGNQSWYIGGGNQPGTYYSRHMNGLKFISGYLFCAVTRSWSTNSEVILHQISEAGNSILTSVQNTGTGIITANDFEVDASLNCYLTGVIQTSSGRKCFTEKFSPGFNLQWRKENQLSNSGSSGMALKVDAGGYIYVACWPETNLFGVSQSVILKYKTDGTLLWSDNTTSGPKYYEPDDIHLDAYGNIDILGSSIVYYPPSIDKAAGSIIVFQYNESIQTGSISPVSIL
ncbi:MAG: hypothetical protein IPJ66_17305 [Bacteroidetes bacterium]|nr:hypothetical protein [Bacteroidota bacterium]